MNNPLNKLTQKPTESVNITEVGRFEIYNLKENPFPRSPFVNKSSTEDKLNGNIFEIAVREKEFEKIKNCFLKVPQANVDHQRLGFINDTSYIGRGNGKSAFLINLLKRINDNYCLDLSDNKNKCFAIFTVPEGGGNIKSFDKFVDLIFDSIIESNIINIAFAMLRLDILIRKYPKLSFDDTSFIELVENLNSLEWLTEKGIDIYDLNDEIKKNPYFKELNNELPISNSPGFFHSISNQKTFVEHYKKLKKDQEKNDFVFTGLVMLFLAAGFNGAYILVDDFERIPEFQSATQKKDFATQLRTILFDGMYLNSKIGFFNFLLALHAGVPRLLETAWSESGMENRVPLNPQTESNNVIAFEKLNERHSVLMLKKYLEHYRIKSVAKGDELFPFNEKSVKLISEYSEYNASKILKMAHQLIDKAASEKRKLIDENFVKTFKNDSKDFSIEIGSSDIITTKTVDLKKKAKKK
ncbi:MAG: hypothetical protein SFY56_10830 [Bacteroidota bacterium]|nr:hypothetical protein [Bacteroidota bacterium]